MFGAGNVFYFSIRIWQEKNGCDRKNNACILKALVVDLDKRDDDTSRL